MMLNIRSFLALSHGITVLRYKYGTAMLHQALVTGRVDMTIVDGYNKLTEIRHEVG